MDKRLSLIIEGESLLNDGTAAALFQIVLAGIISGHLSVSKGVGQFLFAVLGGSVLGFLLGYAASRLTRTIDDPEVQITLTAVVACSSYLPIAISVENSCPLRHLAASAIFLIHSLVPNHAVVGLQLF